MHAAQRAHVDLRVVRAWCRREGHAKKYELYLSRWRKRSAGPAPG